MRTTQPPHRYSARRFAQTFSSAHLLKGSFCSEGSGPDTLRPISEFGGPSRRVAEARLYPTVVDCPRDATRWLRAHLDTATPMRLSACFVVFSPTENRGQAPHFKRRFPEQPTQRGEMRSQSPLFDQLPAKHMACFARLFLAPGFSRWVQGFACGIQRASARLLDLASVRRTADSCVMMRPLVRFLCGNDQQSTASRAPVGQRNRPAGQPVKHLPSPTSISREAAGGPALPGRAIRRPTPCRARYWKSRRYSSAQPLGRPRRDSTSLRPWTRSQRVGVRVSWTIRGRPLTPASSRARTTASWRSPM